MEVLIIIIVAGIIGYVIYQTLPKPKFKKSNSLFNSGKFEDAIKILNSIFIKHPDAPAKLAACKLELGYQVKAQSQNKALKYFNEAIEIKNRWPKNANQSKYDLVAAKAAYEIATILLSNAVATASFESKAKNIKNNLNYIEEVNKSGIENDFRALKKKHFYELAKIFFRLGLQSEKSKKLKYAIQNYSLAKKYAGESSQQKVVCNSITRIGICKLKEKPKDIEFVSFAIFNKADTKYARDFYYRYIFFLLKKEFYTEAATILETRINLPAKTSEQLKKLLKPKHINQAVKKVIEINNIIDDLYKKSFPFNEVKAFYESLDDRIEEIKSVIPDISKKLQAIKPSLFNRMLSHYISSEQFGSGINLIQNYSIFWESPELLKNLGICCYNYTANGKLSKKNYRTIISSWVTSVFSDRVILNCLKETTWDDNYTFTLKETIGSKYQHNDLPKNVNYEDETDTNISIGATQKELVQQFETFLVKTTTDESLSRIVHEFYSKEKEAIEKIISIVKKDILLAAPYFAKRYGGINEIIIKELDNDYLEYSNEESLEAGIPYLKNKSDSYVRDFARAQKSVSSIITAIQHEKINELKAFTTDRKIILIEKYKLINDPLSDFILNAFASKIAEDSEHENLIPLMEECIRFLKNNEILKTQCSNFIQNYCDSKWKTKPSVTLLELMTKSIKYNPDNYRAAKSITILINNNLMDIANNETTTTTTTQIYTLIEDVKNIKSEVLKDSLKELLILRKKILSSMDVESRETVLFEFNLNYDGMKLKHILETMETLGNATY